MKKLLYFTHVPWNWIKQRPQFLAEKLSLHFELTYVQGCSILSLLTSKKKANRTASIDYKSYVRLPKYNPIITKSYKFLDLINEIILCWAIKFCHYDYVWVTSIESYSRIINILPKHTKLIYDCMDDELEFPQVCKNNYARKVLTNYEKRLIDRADVIICSAEHLKQQIINRTETCKHIYVINNATVYPTQEQQLTYREHFRLDKNKHTMLYIGTIAQWFDFESVMAILDYDQDSVCYLIGPLEIELPKHNRIIYLGRCYHSEIWGIMQQADLLLMPFVLNPLIESVNPVKLYEYVWAKKPIIATRYGESMKFNSYCYLYYSKNEILEIYKCIQKNKFRPKQTSSVAINQFISDNTWESRCNEIVNSCLK